MLEPTPINGEISYDFYSEQRLLQSFRDGDKEAFKEIYLATVKGLAYFISNLVYSEQEGEDLVSEVFLKLFSNREIFKSYEHIRRWLYTVARNASLDYLRLRTRTKGIPDELAYLQSNWEEAAETERVKAIVMEKLLQGIAELPPQQRKVVEMSFLESKTTREIAAELGLNEQTILNHKNNGLKHLKKFFDLKHGWEMILVITFLH